MMFTKIAFHKITLPVVRLITLLLLMLSLSISAETKKNSGAIEFKVIALFKNAAMIEHDGKQKMLRKGQTYKQAIKLIEADSHAATFLIDGKKQIIGLHQSKTGGTPFAENNEKTQVSIMRDRSGMYRIQGFINIAPVNFLVDTGASQVAMNEATAKRAGVQYRLKGQKTSVSTASGLARAWAIKLDRVKIGGIELKQVDAVVIQGASPQEVLLGNSFLRQLKMFHDGNLMRLVRNY